MPRKRLATLFGKTRTVAEWARIYNHKPHTIYCRLFRGENLLSALNRPVGKGKLITAFGETRSSSAWAKAAGVQRHAIRKRIRRGWRPDEAVSSLIPKRTYAAFGRTQTLSEWQKEFNVPRSTIHYRVTVVGMSLEAALRLPRLVSRQSKKYRKVDGRHGLE